jgi:hypothetical protein
MKLLWSSLSLALILLVPGTVSAETKKAKPEASPAASAPAKMAEKKLGFHGKIDSVDAKAKTFTIKGKINTRVFHVADGVAITKGEGAAANWDDLKVGEEIRGSYKKDGDKLEAASVKVGPKPVSEKKAKKTE